MQSHDLVRSLKYEVFSAKEPRFVYDSFSKETWEFREPKSCGPIHVYIHIYICKHIQVYTCRALCCLVKTQKDNRGALFERAPTL